MAYHEMVGFDSLIGKTITRIDGRVQGQKITFYCNDGSEYTQYHDQDCCEYVSVEDIIGELDDLIGSPILMAEEATKDDSNADEAGMWTFYKLATVKGYVTIRWYGSSNGYYSVDVSFYMTKKPDTTLDEYV